MQHWQSSSLKIVVQTIQNRNQAGFCTLLLSSRFDWYQNAGRVNASSQSLLGHVFHGPSRISSWDHEAGPVSWYRQFCVSLFCSLLIFLLFSSLLLLPWVPVVWGWCWSTTALSQSPTHLVFTQSVNSLYSEGKPWLKNFWKISATRLDYFLFDFLSFPAALFQKLRYYCLLHPCFVYHQMTEQWNFFKTWNT